MDSFCQLSRKLSPESLSFQYPELVLPEGLGRVGGGGGVAGRLLFSAFAYLHKLRI